MDDRERGNVLVYQAERPDRGPFADINTRQYDSAGSHDRVPANYDLPFIDVSILRRNRGVGQVTQRKVVTQREQRDATCQPGEVTNLNAGPTKEMSCSRNVNMVPNCHECCGRDVNPSIDPHVSTEPDVLGADEANAGIDLDVSTEFDAKVLKFRNGQLSNTAGRHRRGISLVATGH